jgi:hypothetical protein
MSSDGHTSQAHAPRLGRGIIAAPAVAMLLGALCLPAGAMAAAGNSAADQYAPFAPQGALAAAPTAGQARAIARAGGTDAAALTALASQPAVVVARDAKVGPRSLARSVTVALAGPPILGVALVGLALIALAERRRGAPAQL